jgi:hypothetical protein
MQKGGFPSGEDNGVSKLTEAQVREIRRLYSLGGLYQREIAAMFGVKQNAIFKVVHHETWRHVS